MDHPRGDLAPPCAGSAPCVGRGNELSYLRALSGEAARDGERLVMLRGPAGVGKTRLLSELRTRMRLEGAVVLEGRCGWGARAYAPFADVLRGALSFLEEVGAALDADAGPLMFLLGGAAPEEAWATLAAADRREHFFERFGRVLRRVARIRAPILLLDDFHLADAGSIDLLHYLADGAMTLLPDGIDGSRLHALLVCSHRTDDPRAERLTPLSALPNASTLDLDAWGAAGVREFLQNPDVVDRVLTMTGGWPEAVEALVSTRPLDATDRLRDRVAALSPTARRLVEALAVWNRPLLPDVLRDVAGATGASIASGIAEVCDSGLVTRSLVEGEIRLSFARSTDRERLYAAIPEGRRRELHGRVAEHLEREGVTGLALQDLAYHALRSDGPAAAVPFVLDASDALVTTFAHEEAAALLEEALPVAAAEWIEPVLERLVAACRAIGEYRKGLAHAERLLRLRPTDAAARRRVGELFWLLGDYAAATESLCTARTLAERNEDDPLRAEIAADTAEVEYQKGHYDAACGAAEEGLALLGDEENATRLHVENTLGKVLLARGDAEGAAERFGACRESASRLGMASDEVRATINLAITEMRRGRHEVARPLFEAASELATECGTLRLRALCRENLAVLAHGRRDYGVALQHYHEAVRLLRRLGNRPLLARIANNLGELYLDLGELGHARRLAEFSAGLLAGAEPNAVRAEHQLLTARMEAFAGNTAAARAKAREAAKLLDTLAENRLSAEVQVLLARLHEADGEIIPARRALSAVRESDPVAKRAEAAILASALDRAAGDDPLRSAQRALALAEEAEDDESRWRASFFLARAHLDAGNEAAARGHLHDATRIDEALRARVPSEFRASYASLPDRVDFSRFLETLPSRVRDDLAGTSTSVRVEGRAEDTALRVWRERYPALVGTSAAMRDVFSLLDRVAASDALVLVRGESGTGKELAADAIHRLSRRQGRTLVKVNCSALVESLLLSELFGHERGAFTGALARKKGRFEIANGGTLFLDEIGDVSPKTQVSLLRVLQDGCFERVGGSRPVRVDVRVICATNRDLEALVAEGTFREDLYYRLRGLQVDMPPLRDRLDDVVSLAEHFLAGFARERGEVPRTLAPDALDRLRAWHWPGNVREMENTLRSASLLADGPSISARDLAQVHEGLAAVGPSTARIVSATAKKGRNGSSRVKLPPPSDHPLGTAFGRVLGGDLSLGEFKKEFERECIARALRQTKGNITKAATLLGMKRPRLSQLVKEYGLGSTREGEAS